MLKAEVLLTKQQKMKWNNQKSTSSFVLKRGKSEHCSPQQLLCDTPWEKYFKNNSNFSFYITLYSAHHENEIQ